MWNKRNDESPVRRPEPEVPRRDAGPVPQSQPHREPVPQRSPSAAVIGASMHIKGEIHSQEELFIDGEVDGTLELRHALTIGRNGKVRADIKARDVVILGTVKGNVEVTGKIAIRENGSLIGDIRTAGISIDDGAYFKGSIDIIRSEPAKPVVHTKVAEPGAA
ncbi:MAG TPA: polymer-forming cytoskeletal protein [Bryobacteraceae bacterium]|nr:polymer-forming cytoskeletal protein [Bryobacteraceae bacterium]